MKEKPNFTKKQREYILRRDGNRCQFHTFDGRKWVRCTHTTKLQVHHVIPRHWAYTHLPPDFVANELNNRGNLLTLCDGHHIGTHWQGDCVHPDTREALERYHRGDKGAYKAMVQKRAELTKQGKPYWNTVFDWMFVRILKRVNQAFTEEYPPNAKEK